MPAEERGPLGGLDREDQGPTEEHSFDELSKGLAAGALSRRRAIKLAGSAFLGGALAVFGLTDAAERSG